MNIKKNVFFSPPGKLPTSKGGLVDLNATTAVTSELWSAPKSSRGPPPGLSTKGGSLANGWSGNLGNSIPWVTSQRNSGSWGGTSTWLLLRNLTAQVSTLFPNIILLAICLYFEIVILQIDGSTLRTLCMQHGPLMSFHLYLHQGFALAKYSSREEATKVSNSFTLSFRFKIMCKVL